MTSRFAYRVMLALLCVALVTLAPAAAEEPAKAKAPERSEESKVYTNADLRRPQATPATDAEAADSAATPADPAEETAEPVEQTAAAAETAKTEETDAQAEANPLDWMKARQAQQAERERLIQEAEVRLAEARTEVAAIEKRIAAIRNPYLAPPKPAEDDEKWSGQNNVERLESSKSELEEARLKVTEVEAELRELRSGS